MNRKSLTIALAAVALCWPAHLLAQREDRVLTDKWKFTRKDIKPTDRSDKWESVTIPHTWNAVDGRNGLAADPEQPEGYYRGPAWYDRALEVPKEWKGKRVFVRFEAACLVSDVFINNTHIGQHRGGYAAFCFEVTDYLKYDGKDRLKVRVDNSRAFDVAPLSGDFTIFGGIYRPVHLIATDETCISLTHFASSGVYMTYKGTKSGKAEVSAEVHFSNSSDKDSSLGLEFEVKSPDGTVVATEKTTAKIKKGDSDQKFKFSIANPRLWDGVRDPYVYQTTVKLTRDGKVIDQVEQPLGLRTVELTQDKGFLLNGKPYAMHGVNRHQERAGKGVALSNEDHEEDIRIIREMGTTTLRLAHYQQADYVHQLCDKTGLVTWQEIPLVDCVSGSPEFLENARQQLQEMIYQDWNHPSIGMWSLFNELDASWAAVPTAPSVPVIKNLNELAHKLDSSRLIVGATWPQNPGPRHFIPDAIGWNIYPGWYTAKVEDATDIIDGYYKEYKNKRIALSEYGAGANPFQFQDVAELKMPDQGGPFHPQEWQNHFHEGVWKISQNNPKLWGTYVWAMFDFAIDKRNEGGIPGQNDKGLVTADRKTRKDTFYFYQANWTQEPMIHLASKLATKRKLPTTEIKAYTNCPEVELKVNGTSIGKGKPDEIKVIRWPDVKLEQGVNKIELTSVVDGKTITESAEWTRE
jgi:beta-galactosidase